MSAIKLQITHILALQENQKQTCKGMQVLDLYDSGKLQGDINVIKVSNSGRLLLPRG
jgi:hypothetical protein